MAFSHEVLDLCTNEGQMKQGEYNQKPVWCAGISCILGSVAEIVNSESPACTAVSQIKVKQATNFKWILPQTTQSPSDRVMLSGSVMYY